MKRGSHNPSDKLWFVFLDETVPTRENFRSSKSWAKRFCNPILKKFGNFHKGANHFILRNDSPTSFHLKHDFIYVQQYVTPKNIHQSYFPTFAASVWFILLQQGSENTLMIGSYSQSVLVRKFRPCPVRGFLRLNIRALPKQPIYQPGTSDLLPGWNTHAKWNKTGCTTPIASAMPNRSFSQP